MLTRDITIADCILDLIDNSLDSAWKTIGGAEHSIEQSDKLSSFNIDITLDPNLFRIVDDCGGMPIEAAEGYAFNFGAEEGAQEREYSVGVYGIGMKRALFKIAQTISVKSTHGQGKNAISFEVPISVEAWLSERSGDWVFEIIDAEALESPGVDITATDLNPDVSSTFSDPAFAVSLRKTIAEDYMLAFQHGISMSVNGVSVVPDEMTLMTGDDFVPMRSEYTDGEATVTVIAGMRFAPPEDADDPQSTRTQRPSGWTVLCNGRAVLKNDTTSLSGWGQGLPKWHPQYAGFAGYVLFSSPDPSALPMTTTKRSVDASRGIYKRALDRMSRPTRVWIDYTNSRKSRTEEAEQYESTTRPVTLDKIEAREETKLPALVSEKEQIANIAYARPVKQVRALAAALGAKSLNYRAVGIASFERAYSELVDEDED
jgi:hypothetical protein